MSLLSPFEDFDATASWVSSTAQVQPKFALGDHEFPNFDVANAAPMGHPMGDNDLETLFGIKFPSPQMPDPIVFDTGLPLSSHTAPPTSAYHSALATMTGNSPSSSSNKGNALKVTDKGPNALQLDMLDSFTPAGSPLAASSGYTSPSFQFSPTPALTMCPTVDSTPAPRSNSRCSSRSSFSAQTEDIKPCVARLAAASAAGPPRIAAAISSTDAKSDVNVGPDGKPKKQHLCPYEDCARHTRTFRSNADLQRHIRSHRGERPYACPAPACGKAYGQQNKMVNHVKQQHPALLPTVQIGRSRRRTPVSAPVSAASSRAPSVSTTPSAASTPGTTPVRALGPARSSVAPARPSPYSVPMSNSHLLGGQTARRDNGGLNASLALLRHDVFGTNAMW